jgi:hypothetical protein
MKKLQMDSLLGYYYALRKSFPANHHQQHLGAVGPVSQGRRFCYVKVKNGKWLSLVEDYLLLLTLL